MKSGLSILPAILALFIAGQCPMSAEVRFPRLLSDHEVLQRAGPIHVWGWSSPGAHLTVRFHQQRVETQADVLGKWSLYLAPEDAGGPYSLKVSGDSTDQTITDLLVGDVWLASGQSNMEIPLNGFPPIAIIKTPPLRSPPPRTPGSA